LPLRQTPFWQHPLGQLIGLQLVATHWPPAQTWPMPQAAHCRPFTPHCVCVFPGKQKSPWQQPLGQVFESQNDTPVQTPLEQVEFGGHAAQAPPPTPHIEGFCTEEGMQKPF
jgi:hypothetical protein